MREVMAARSARDATAYHDGPRGSRRALARRPSPLAGFARHVVARPGRIVAIGLFLAAGAAIGVNALVFQTARHPAPLFGPPAPAQSLAARPPLPPAPPAALQAPAPAPARQDFAELFVPVAPAPRELGTEPRVPTPLPPTRARDIAASEPARTRGPDPIGALLRGEIAETASVSRAADPDPRIEAAQRALHNLGHGPLVADGMFGPATRAAIERFEAAQGLPVTGRLDAATVRALAVRSGIAID